MNRSVFLIGGFLLGIYISVHYPDLGDKSYSMMQDAITFVKEKLNETQQGGI